MLYRTGRLPQYGLTRPCRHVRPEPVSRYFHTSPFHRQHDSGIPDHYATLELQPNATAGEVKKYVCIRPSESAPNFLSHTSLSEHPSLTTTSSAQEILQPLQNPPPRPQPTQPLRKREIRQNLRSVRHARIRRKARTLRPRLSPLLLLLLPLTHSQGLVLLFLASRRPSRLRPQPPTHALQGPAAVVLQVGWLGRAGKEAG